MRYEVRFRNLAFCVFILAVTAATVLGQQDSNHVASGRPTGPAGLPDLATKVGPSVVTILVYGEEGDEPSSRGTGWFIAPGQIVTNRHLLAGGKRVEIRLSTGITVPVTGVLTDDEDRDLALLAVEITDSLLPPLPLAESGARERDSIFLVDGPSDSGGTLLRGVISAKQDLPDLGEFLQTTVTVSPDASGCPVLDMQGMVIGIATVRVVDGKYLSFAPTVEALQALKPGPVRTLAEWAATPPKDSAQTLACLLGLFHLIDKDYEKALAHYTQAAQRDSLDSRVALSAGYCLYYLDRWEEALQAYQRAIHGRPDNARAYLGLGHSYWELGRTEEGIRAFEQAIRVQPDYPRAYFALGWAYDNLERWEAAISAYKQAILLKPDDAHLHSYLGTVYARLGRGHQAIVECTEAIRIEPDHPHAHYVLGKVYLMLDQTQEAIEELKQTICIVPDHAGAHHDLGIAYLGLGRTQEGIDELKAAVHIEPDFAMAHFNLGSVYLLQDDRKAALEEYRILRELDRDLAAKLFDLINP